MSNFWSAWIIVITAITLIGCCWLLISNRKTVVKGDLKEGEAPTTGHVYDGIEEYDNPLPAWWFWKFVGTIVFTVIYLILFPGLGKFEGVLGWTQEKQWQSQIDAAAEKIDTQYATYHATAVDDLAGNPAAIRMGRRLFNNNCSICHGVGGVGANGFPNLTDSDWLYGGSAEAIKASVANGRQGVMPGWSNAIGEQGVVDVTEYVLSISGNPFDAEKAERGQQTFATFCGSCHGADGIGLTALGAPNLTDNIWLYNQSDLTLAENIRHSVRSGRTGNMPSHVNQLREEKIHLITAYVYSLSRTNQ